MSLSIISPQCYATFNSVHSFVKKHEAACKMTACAAIAIPALIWGTRQFLSWRAQANYTSFIENHPEFKELLERAQSVTQYDRPKHGTRDIEIGQNSAGVPQLFIKRCERHMPESLMGALVFPANDQLAYLLSERFHLHVVPPTMALAAYPDAIEWIFPPAMHKKLKSCRDSSFDRVVVQAAIQIRQDRLTAQLDAIPANLDMEQVQKAVIFVTLFGKWQGYISNSVIDDSNKVMEVDNEALNAATMHNGSWLLPEFWTTKFDRSVIEQFLSTPETTIDAIFNREMGQLCINGETRESIKERYRCIRKIFEENSCPTVGSLWLVPPPIGWTRQ
jgi:hypothetical protein